MEQNVKTKKFDVKKIPIVKFLVDNFMDSSYCIGYRFSNRNFWSEDISKFEVFKPSQRYWYADPMPFRYKDRFYIFMERYDCFKNIGDIVLSAIDHKGRMQDPRTVISGETHLSFPIIIPYKGQYYMMPETSATKSIDVYKMKETPYHWESYCSIELKEEIVDVAWVMDNQDIMLLGGVLDNENPMYVKRQIIRVSHLEDINNICYEIGYTDASASLKVRNGGGFLSGAQNIYRVVQESTEETYGLNLLLNRVSELSDNSIQETSVKRKTVKNIDVKLKKLFYKKIGLHTYGLCEGGFEVVDISVVKWSLIHLIKMLKLHTVLSIS